MNALSSELKKYKIENPKLIKEIGILFPEISEVSLGKMNNYYSNDSVSTSTVLLYKADKNRRRQTKNGLQNNWAKLISNSLKRNKINGSFTKSQNYSSNIFK